MNLDDPKKMPADRVNIKLDSMQADCIKAVNDALEGRKKLINQLIKDRFENFDVEEEFKKRIDRGITQGMKEVRKEIADMTRDTIMIKIKRRVRKHIREEIDLKAESIAENIIENISFDGEAKNE